MNLSRRLRVWRMHKAERLTAAFIHPIFEVVDPILLLRSQVGFVCLRYRLRGEPSRPSFAGDLMRNTDLDGAVERLKNDAVPLS